MSAKRPNDTHATRISSRDGNHTKRYAAYRRTDAEIVEIAMRLWRQDQENQRKEQQ